MSEDHRGNLWTHSREAYVAIQVHSWTVGYDFYP